jgi:ABC-2 type transport system ATP-binding protein
MSEIAISTQRLTKSYGPVQALRGVDLEVARGEIFGFLGPNGAGKTTTIRCLLDLIRPNGGTVRVIGLDPQKQPVQVRARAGYLPGELAFEGNLTVDAGLRYLASLRGGKFDRERVRSLAERLDLDLKPQFKNLSKGNKQKVGVVQALMHRPELLLLDEPTAGLDPLMQQEVLRMVKEAKQDGATVFFSSHIISEVEQVAERVGIIRSGVVAETADVRDIKRRALWRARVRFGEAVETEFLSRVPGVRILSRDDGQSVILQIEGEMDALIKALARHPVSEFETERPTLEEIFMAYYAEGKEAK